MMKRTLGKLSYDRNDVIGHGSFGIVFKGVFEGVKPVAIKRIDRTSADSSAEFKKEAEIMLRVRDHPNIIRYFCYEMDEHFL